MLSWLKFHPNFSSLPQVQDENIDFETVRKAFEMAHKLNPKDPQVLLALGVLSFI